MKAPCYKCEDRYYACHDTCKKPDYIENRKLIIQIRKARNKNLAQEIIKNGYSNSRMGRYKW